VAVGVTATDGLAEALGDRLEAGDGPKDRVGAAAAVPAGAAGWPAPGAAVVAGDAVGLAAAGDGLREKDGPTTPSGSSAASSPVSSSACPALGSAAQAWSVRQSG